MSGAPLPPVIPEPFAKNADPSFIQNPIPQTTGAPGRASYDLGFPPLSMQPIAAGGKSPFGQDFNGLLFAITSQQYFAQAGQLWPYNATVAAAIGGYGVGSVLSSSDGTTVWVNTVNGNTNDPDSLTGTNQGWVAIFKSGYFTQDVSAGGTFPLKAFESASAVIILIGVLSGNAAIVLPPQLRDWLIVNNTTGAFSVVVRTASGTGVTIPQGGFSNPVGVYGDGTNIYPTVPAASLIPADQQATPLTLAQRTNTALLIASNFSMSAAPNSNTVANVWTDTGNGISIRTPLAWFESAMALSSIGGAVVAGQVPSVAVTQYTPAILASAALTGVPTTPTPAIGSTSNQVINAAFVNPSSNLVAQGSRQNPDGSIEKWGSLNIGDVVAPTGGTITFPVAFPSACYNVEITGFDANLTGATFVTSGGVITAANFSWFAREIASATQNVTLYWRAIGK